MRDGDEYVVKNHQEGTCSHRTTVVNTGLHRKVFEELSSKGCGTMIG